MITFFTYYFVLQGSNVSGLEYLGIFIAFIAVMIQAAIKGEAQVKKDKEYCEKNGINYDYFLKSRSDKTEKSRARRIPKSTRSMILRRDNYQCQYCGSSDNLHIDHIYPFS